MRISEIRDVCPAWQRVVPFQSLSQLLSFSAIYGAFIGIVYLIFRDSTNPNIFATVCTGVTAGAVPPLFIALPQEFIVECNSEYAAASTVKQIDELLRFRGYKRKDGPEAAAAGYISKLPALLSWKENSFSISRSETSIIVRGPKGSIKWLRDRLSR